jgi:hypothetical protein
VRDSRLSALGESLESPVLTALSFSRVAISFPVWSWLQNPTSSSLCASYEMGLSTEHSYARRLLISSMWFQNLFRDNFKLSEERSQAEVFENQLGGCMQAVSTDWKAMGRGGDFAICDDLNSADDVLSDTLRKTARAIRRSWRSPDTSHGKCSSITVTCGSRRSARSRRARKSEPGHSRPILRDPLWIWWTRWDSNPRPPHCERGKI